MMGINYEFTNYQDHVGRQLGIWSVANPVRRGYGYELAVGVGMCWWDPYANEWARYPGTDAKTYLKPSRVLPNKAVAHQWIEHFKKCTILEIANKPGVIDDDAPLVKPSELAEQLGAVSLAHLSRMSGVSVNTLLNWHRNKYEAFVGLCRQHSVEGRDNG